MDTQKVLVSALLILIGVSALLGPLLRYVIAGWAMKQKDITNGLNESTCHCYFKMFIRSDMEPDQNGALTAFRKMHVRWFGRKFFFWPL